MVVGSVHLDLQVAVPRLPGPGETVLGSRYHRSPGGKGANQSVAAAVAGRPVTLVGRVGDDPEGRMVRSEIEASGVDVRHVRTDPAEPTGVALIVVDEAGANQIAVSPGASGRLDPDDVARAAEAITAAAVLLLQLEVPIETVHAAAGLAGTDTLVILNPAPARYAASQLPANVDLLVPNLVELGQLAGEDGLDGLDRIAGAARRLPGAPTVVVTLGADGALLIDAEGAIHAKGEPVSPVDTTGAGDAFCGALASSLASGTALPAALEAANRFAARSTTRRGALSSFLPDRADRPGWG